jgi:hypothetical protein
MDIFTEYGLYSDIDRKFNAREVNCSNLVLAGTSRERRTGGSTNKHTLYYYTVELGYNFMKGTEYVLSFTSVVLTEMYITVNSKELIGTTEYLTL